MRITSSTSTRDNTSPSTTTTTTISSSSAAAAATTTTSPTINKHEILSKCAKMTEGEHRIHGMNGASDNGNGSVNAGAAGALIVKQEKIDGDGTSGGAGPADTYNNLGGRLKFFKNGRFILELARAREGEKVAWVPVPKKTFWPPPGSTSSLSTYRQESSTSLSVSDDNSSIQSSPWQRDHTWKQTSPQRNISSNLNFYFVNRKKRSKSATSKCWLNKLQRCPYLILTDEQRTKCSSQTKCNNIKCININVKLNKSAICLRKTLVNVVEFLWNKTLQTFNSITSPRKRILRELERVTIDDDLSIYNKRCRGKINQKTTQHTNNITNTNTNTSNNNSGSGNNSNSNGIINGCEEKQTQRNTSNSGKNCSYSITSLLGDENKTDKTSSSSSSSSSQSNKNMIEIHLKKRPESPPPQHYSYMSAPPTPTQFMSPYQIYSSVLHHHPATVTTTSATAAAVNYISPYYHHHHHGAAYGAVRPSAFYQPPLMTQPIGPRHEAYSSPWNTYEQHLPLHRDDSSDVPLNLSKHAD